MAERPEIGECLRMKKLRLLSLVGITSIALAQAGWAGHAVGIGVGPHFGGGISGFRGGALAAGHVGGGVGSRGGGVGFGGARFSGNVPNFAGAGLRFSSMGHPSSRQPVYDARPNRSVTSNITSNRAAMASTVRPSQTLPQRRVNGQIDHHIAERHDTNWHHDWDRRHAHFDHGRCVVFNNGFWFGLDNGFFPWDYLPYYADDYYPYDYYADSLPYNNNAYNIDPADSATVQAVQRQLLDLGYYNGSIDGVFGPATRDAVAKYQIAKQLNVTGSLSPDTLQSLNLPQGTAS